MNLGVIYGQWSAQFLFPRLLLDISAKKRLLWQWLLTFVGFMVLMLAGWIAGLSLVMVSDLGYQSFILY